MYNHKNYAWTNQFQTIILSLDFVFSSRPFGDKLLLQFYTLYDIKIILSEGFYVCVLR